MRSISMTIAHPAAQVAGCSGALRAITVGAENARSRVLAGPRDGGRHFVSKCSHCACSVSHERGPNARSYVKSPLSLSLCDQIQEKKSLPLNTKIRTSKQKFAKCGHQVQVSRAPTASIQWLIQKKKCKAFSCNVKLCFVRFERPQTRSRLGQLHAEGCNFCSLHVTF